MKQFQPSIERLRDAGGIVVVRDGVEELDRTPRAAQRPERIGERARIQALFIHRDMDDIALVGAEDPECADVTGCLAQHHIARIAEDAGEKIETLLRADRDHHIVRVGRDVFQPHHLTNCFADGRLALARAVLHGTPPVVEHQLVEDGTDHIQRKIGDVGHATGE